MRPSKIEPLSIEYTRVENGENSTFDESADHEHNCWATLKSHSSSIPFLLLVIVLIVLLFLTVAASVSKGTAFNVVLFGDSLIGYTESSYHIAAQIKQNVLVQYPDMAMNVYTSGVGGNRIADLKARMYNDALHRSWLAWAHHTTTPDAIIMYWDSDATDVDETGHKAEIRATYEANLLDVLSTLQSQVEYFAFGGPSLYGEKPYGENRRDDILDDYAAMNRDAATLLNITYLETRALFWSNLPPDWNQDSGYLTLDGEHHNERGAQLIVTMFSELIIEWLATHKS